MSDSILVTGHTSMIGKAVYQKLVTKPKTTIIASEHTFTDLLRQTDTNDLFYYTRPNYVVHLAGYNGNIQFNNNFPADIYYQTTQMGLNVLKCCQEFKVKKVVSVLASCSYPSNDILYENTIFDGPPHESVECHGFAKRTLFEYSRQLYKQYGLNANCIVFNTCYGPHDNFDENKTKVVGSLIKKFVQAKKNSDSEVVCWGTGQARREFIYVDDVAEGIVRALDRYNDPMNVLHVGSGKDYSISGLAQLIADLVGYKGRIVWDTNKPDGQKRKLLYCSRMKRVLDWEPKTELMEGLEKTIKWYLKR